MGPDDELAITVDGYFDTEPGTPVNPSDRGGPGERLEGKFALVDEVFGRRGGLDRRRRDGESGQGGEGGRDEAHDILLCRNDGGSRTPIPSAQRTRIPRSQIRPLLRPSPSRVEEKSSLHAEPIGSRTDRARLDQSHLIHFSLWWTFLAFHAFDLCADALGTPIMWPAAVLAAVPVLDFLAIVWLAPDALRSFCLKLVSSNMH
jgi:hypothetical protein